MKELKEKKEGFTYNYFKQKLLLIQQMPYLYDDVFLYSIILFLF